MFVISMVMLGHPKIRIGLEFRVRIIWLGRVVLLGGGASLDR